MLYFKKNLGFYQTISVKEYIKKIDIHKTVFLIVFWFKLFRL